MNILLTSVGRRTYMVEYFKKALNDNGLVHASNSEHTYSLEQADKHVITPPIYNNGYIHFLIDYCKTNSINAVISLFDIDLPILSKNKFRFEEINVNLVVSDENAVILCNDKWKTHEFLISIGLKQPKTYISFDKLRNDINAGLINFPIIVKPRWGMGSIGIMQADSQEELDVFYKKLHRDIFKTYLKYESQQDAESCLLFQEKIIGTEFGLDILNDLKANYVTTVAKQKLAMRAGETDIAQIVDGRQFESVATLLARKLRHIANLDVDCFVTENNELFVLEMNCRFGGQYPFSHLAGVDFPKQIVKWLSGESTDKNLITPQIGIKGCKELTPVILKL
jgi:carbamoyl-phosphate synthase large subunit